MKKIIEKIKKIKIGETEKKIIIAVGLGLLVATVIVFPNLPIALKPFLKRRGKNEFKRSLKRLEEKGVIYLSGDRIKLTKRGNQLAQKYAIENVEISRPKKWDGLWHLVSYDIPNEKKKERDWFRSTLKRLEFKQIQESLWVHPYECSQEIAVVAQNLRISPYVAIMIARTIPGQSKVREYFDL